MTESNGHANIIGTDLAAALGANADVSAQSFTIYVPNKDRNGVETGDQRKWVLEALQLLTRLNGGATAMPPAEGVWGNERGEQVWEHPIVVYSFIRPAEFYAALPAIREFVHRMGRETNQGEVVVEMDGLFFRITEFDPPTT